MLTETSNKRTTGRITTTVLMWRERSDWLAIKSEIGCLELHVLCIHFISRTSLIIPKGAEGGEEERADENVSRTILLKPEITPEEMGADTILRKPGEDRASYRTRSKKHAKKMNYENSKHRARMDPRNRTYGMYVFLSVFCFLSFCPS